MHRTLEVTRTDSKKVIYVSFILHSILPLHVLLLIVVIMGRGTTKQAGEAQLSAKICVCVVGGY